MSELMDNEILICSVCAWFSAQLIKTLVELRLKKTFNIRRFFGMGGMPSSHTAFLVSMTVMVAAREGLGSTAFALSFALMSVVVYDAMGVRYQTGRQSHVINRILHRMLVEGKPLGAETLQELVGHTPTEVFFGAVIGLVMPLFFR